MQPNLQSITLPDAAYTGHLIRATLCIVPRSLVACGQLLCRVSHSGGCKQAMLALRCLPRGSKIRDDRGRRGKISAPTGLFLDLVLRYARQHPVNRVGDLRK